MSTTEDMEQVVKIAEEAARLEREACAQLCDEAAERAREQRREIRDHNSFGAGMADGEVVGAEELAAAIRARGSKP